MNRRKSIKALLIGTASAGLVLDACQPDDKKVAAVTPDGSQAEADRMAEEKKIQ